MAAGDWLGVKVKDRVTGFEGVVTGHVTYISGCNQCLVMPKVLPDGKLPDGNWFDEQRLEPQSSAPKVVLDNHTHNPGFDQAPPVR